MWIVNGSAFSDKKQAFETANKFFNNGISVKLSYKGN